MDFHQNLSWLKDGLGHLAPGQYPIHGTYERYHVDIGNIRLLFLSDRNDLPAPYGRGEGGFFVDGAITMESYMWLLRQVITWPERILIVACHHPLKDTTVGSGMDDSWTGQYLTFYSPDNVKHNERRMQGTLHQVYPLHDFDTPLFEHLLSQNPGSIDVWISGHIHHRADETFRGRGKYAKAYGGHHLNIANLCRYRHHVNVISAQSNRLSFKAGDDHMHSQVYVHDHPTLPSGFYPPEDRSLQLKCAVATQATELKITSPKASAQNIRTHKIGNRHVRLMWNTDAVGTLVIRSESSTLSLTPADGDVYYVGQSLAEGEVVHMGTGKQISPVSKAKEDQFFHFFTYNAGQGLIMYQRDAAATFAFPKS